MNLFWKQKNKPGSDYLEKENNVTHALLVTLQKEPKFLAAVLKGAGIKTKLNRKYRVDFQITKKEKINTIEAKNKYILFIYSKYNTSEVKKEIDHKAVKSILDGLIIDNKTAIIIEAKVGAKRDNTQLNKYNKAFYNGQCPPSNIKEIHWETIHKLAGQYNNSRKTIGSYLVRQLHEYLEDVSMAGFDGIPFFDKDTYEKDVAAELLKRLGTDLKNEEWFKKRKFKLAERPKTGSVWDYFYKENIKCENPRKFPHYSIYIFPDYFGVDMLFHKKELKIILKDDTLRDNLFKEIYKLSKDPDYFFKFVDYRKLANKTENSGVRTGSSYETLEFIIQLKNFRKNHKNKWQIELRKYLDILLKEKHKQISILKKAYYKDKKHNKLSNGKECLNYIYKVTRETEKLHNMMLEHYK